MLAMGRESKLLRDWLSPQQLTSLIESGWFYVKGSAGGEYKIGPDRFQRTFLKGWGPFSKALTMNHCVQLRYGTQVDRLIGLKVMLENDEPGVRASTQKW